MKIVLWPDPILATKCESVDPRDPGLKPIIEDMYQIMKAAKGVGLASNQVGLNKRLLILDIGEGLEVFYNPELIGTKGLREPMNEGCLSVPSFYAKVERYREITIRHDVVFEPSYLPGVVSIFAGFRAHVLQHEIEHLDGHIFIEHLSRAKREAARAHMRGGMAVGPPSSTSSRR